MPLEGTLKDMSLPNLVQLQCSEQKRARVQVVRRNIEGTLFFSDGELHAATAGPLAGETAVYELLAWDEGIFHVSESVTPLPARNVTVPWQTLVLEGLRRADEIKSERAQCLAQAAAEMRKISGAADWRLCTIDGQELNAAGECIASELAEWAAQRLDQAARVGNALNMGKVRELVFASEAQRRVLFPRERHWLAVTLKPNASLSAARDALAQMERT